MVLVHHRQSVFQEDLASLFQIHFKSCPIIEVIVSRFVYGAATQSKSFQISVFTGESSQVLLTYTHGFKICDHTVSIWL